MCEKQLSKQIEKKTNWDNCSEQFSQYDGIETDSFYLAIGIFYRMVSENKRQQRLHSTWK